VRVCLFINLTASHSTRSLSFASLLVAMCVDSRRASMIRRKAPGPYVDIVGPTVLTVILMISIVAQFSIKLFTLM
jgi:hypothetical protein